MQRVILKRSRRQIWLGQSRSWPMAIRFKQMILTQASSSKSDSKKSKGRMKLSDTNVKL